MDEVKKMLRAVINGQTALKQELLNKISKVDRKVGNLDKKVDTGFRQVNRRIDKVGKQLAYLEDDAPTREEHEELEKRVGKVESKIASL